MSKSLDEQVKELQRQQSVSSGSRLGRMSSLGSMVRKEVKAIVRSTDPVIEATSSPFGPDSCDVCGGLGVIRYDVPIGHERWGKLFPCTNPDCPKMLADRAHRASVVLSRSGVPERYRDMTFETFMNLPDEARAGKELAAASMYMMAQARHNNFYFDLYNVVKTIYPDEANVFSMVTKNWVVLQGPFGVGKTGIAASFANMLAPEGINADWYRLDDLFSEIQSKYDGDPRDDPSAPFVTARSVQDEMIAARVLVVDDFNTHHVTNDRRTIVESLIRNRAGERRATIITTNLSQDEFSKMWTERTASIVREQAHWLLVGGEKIRRDDAPIGGW